MIYTPSNVLNEAKNYCYEAEYYTMEELTYINDYIKTYVDSMAFIDGKRAIKFERVDLLDQIERKQHNKVFNTEVEKIFYLMEEGCFDFKNKNLNKSVYEFIIDDNGYSINDFERFKKGLSKYIEDDIFVLFESIQRIIDRKVEEYHEVK